MPGPALSATQVAKTFGGTRALADFDLQIEPGEIHALVGENGSGKSTFIKVLAGYHTPDDGAEVSVGGSALKFGSPDSAYERGCRFVHQDLGLIDDRSVLDNLCLNGGFPTRLGTIRAREVRAHAAELLEKVGLAVDPAARVGDLSPATKTGVAVARALRSDPRRPTHLLVLDEPTATMPDDEVEHLLTVVRRVAAGGIGVLYVSHRLDEIFRLCDRVTVLRDGHKVASGSTTDFTRSTLVNALVGTEFEDIHRDVDESDLGKGIARLEVRGLRAASIQQLNLTVEAGTVTGIAGITGSGREKALGAIFGAVDREAGVVSVDGAPIAHARPADAIRRGVAYLPPDRKTLGGILDKTARENLSLLDLTPFWHLFRLRRKPEVREAATWFSRLSVRPADGMERPLSTFSGGNQQKILFAKWLRINPSVLLLDEPTQGVDIGAKAALHHQLLDVARDGGTVLVSSTDVEELAAICTRVVVMRNGRIAADLTGEALNQGAITRACLGTDQEVMT